MYRPLLLAFAALPFLAAPASAQNVDQAPPASAERVAPPLNLAAPESGDDAIYNNGPLVNCAGCGLDGADESILETVTLGTGVFGFGANNAAAVILADDFTIPAGETWEIDTLVAYSYQTGSGDVSTITGLFVEIYDGDPAAGGSVIHGDQTTNVMLTTDWSGAYRVTETTTGANGDRPIMEVVGEVGLTLTEGTYWISYSLTGSVASGPWVPEVATMGACYEGNAQQFISGAWAQIQNISETNMTGCYNTDGWGVELPFLFYGTVMGGSATEGTPGVPGEFSLAAAIPNPAVAGARVAVTVERPQALVVEAFDVLGRRVASLHDGAAAVGTFSVQVDASALPAGVYVIRATGERGTATRTLTIAR